MEILKEVFETAEVSAVFLIPIVAGFVQAFKLAFTIQDRFLPLISLLIGGVSSSLLAFGFNTPLPNAILIGVISGLGASGLYDNIKKAGKVND